MHKFNVDDICINVYNFPFEDVKIISLSVSNNGINIYTVEKLSNGLQYVVAQDKLILKNIPAPPVSFKIGDRVRFKNDCSIRKLKVGDEGIIQSFSNNLINGYDVEFMSLVHITPAHITTLVLNNEIELVSIQNVLNGISQASNTHYNNISSPTQVFPSLPDFLVGDIVEYISTDSTILKYGTKFELTKVDSEFTIQGRELNTSKDYTFLKDNIKLISRGLTSSISNTNHVCVWKNYKGLNYQEDYCDCGATKNKRGLFS